MMINMKVRPWTPQIEEEPDELNLYLDEDIHLLVHYRLTPLFINIVVRLMMLGDMAILTKYLLKVIVLK